ncbi:hypothetical protein ABZY36_29685 [Streptomyces sp. NPDC006627]|uniref:hypothetical protein n=1 Tax=Streptomyces sp. NPDC006627 TaxID=3154679 RepID=UPI0033B53A1C
MTFPAPLRTLAAVFAVVALAVTVSACDEDGEREGGASDQGGVSGGDGTSGGDGASDAGDANPGRNGGASGGPEVRQKMMLDNMPEVGTVMAAGEYLQRFTACERYSIDPSDERYYPMDEKFDASWGVRFRGTCDDGGHGYIRVFKTDGTDGMERFQSAYKADVAERMERDERAAIKGGFAIGKDFAVIAPDGGTIRDLSASGLLVLNCNPNFRPTGDVATAPALVDGCVLTDEFVA